MLSSVVSLLRRSNFYQQDYLAELPSLSFKEPQRVTPVALSASRTWPVRNSLILKGFVGIVNSSNRLTAMRKFILASQAGGFLFAEIDNRRRKARKLCGQMSI